MEGIKKLDGNVGVDAENSMKRDYMKTAEKVTDVAKEAKSSANEAVQNVQKYCRENPGIAMGIAAGVGALVSLALMKAFSGKESDNEKMISDLFRGGEKMWNRMKSGVEPAVKHIKESVGV